MHPETVKPETEKATPSPAETKKVFAKFQNLETPGAPLTWAWNGTIHTFADGQVYLMEEEQIDHLNSLQVVSHKQEINAYGQLVSSPADRRNRFAVRTVGPTELKKLKEEYGDLA